MKVKLVLSFAIVALISAIVGIVGIVGLKVIDSSYTTAFEQNSRPIPTLAHVVEYCQQLRVQVRTII